MTITNRFINISKKLVAMTAMFSASFSFSISLFAEAVFDGSVGANAAGTTYSGAFTITEADGQVNGNNLFQSLSTFNVNMGESASFTHDSSNINNIIVRVTGGDFSTIDGGLNSDASLWLLNPNGFVFNENASVNINGSFYVSTADYLKFADEQRFYADLSQGLSLSIAEPDSFGFLNGDVGTITLQNTELTVDTNETLTMVGGNITLVDSFVGGYDTNVSLSATAATGEIPVDSQLGQASILLGDITLERSSIDTSGDRAGDIYIRSGRLVVTDESAIDAAAHADVIDVNASPAQVFIAAQTIELTDNGRVTVDAHNHAVGATVYIEADHLLMSRGEDAGVSALSWGNSHAGSITVNAETIEMSQDGSLVTDVIDNGSSGGLSVTAQTLSIDGSETEYFTGISGDVWNSGTGGDIHIDAEQINISHYGQISNNVSKQGGQGVGGSLTIETDHLALQDKASIVADADNAGTTGALTISSLESVTLSSGSSISMNTHGLSQGSQLSLEANSVSLIGDSTGIEAISRDGSIGSDITLDAQSILLQEGGYLSTTSVDQGEGGDIRLTTASLTLDSDSMIEVDAEHQSIGGSITINAEESIEFLNQGGILVNAYDEAFGGDVVVNTSQFTISGGQDAGISAVSWDNSRSGNITVTADTITMSDDAVITSDVIHNGISGDISIETNDLFIDGSEGDFSTEIASNVWTSGQGGSIDINAQHIQITNDGLISTRTRGEGGAGSIHIDTQQLTIEGQTSSDFITGIVAYTESDGHGGSIRIDAEKININGKGFISAQAFSGSGDAGSIELHVNDLALNNQAIISTSSFDQGNAGDLVVYAGDIHSSNSEISSFNHGAASAGSIFIDARNIVLFDGATISTEVLGDNVTERDNGIEVYASSLSLNSGASISTNASGAASAGAVLIDVDKAVTIDNSSITTESVLGGGGNITLNARDILQLRAGLISTSVAGGVGDSGNINIDPIFIILQDQSVISANALGGDGGNISLVGEHIIQSPDSRIEASSSLGVNGSIDVVASEFDASDINKLSVPLLNVSDFSQKKCDATNASGSYFLVSHSGQKYSSPALLNFQQIPKKKNLLTEKIIVNKPSQYHVFKSCEFLRQS